MPRNPWSGLAPAVDAHIAYWAKANRAVPLIERVITHGGADLLQAAVRDHHLHRWLIFGASYGIPDANGVPQIVVSPRQDGDAVALTPTDGTALATSLTTAKGVMSEGEFPIIEGSTIIGREQFSAEGATILQGFNLANREHAMLAQATSHYVSAEVSEEITQAALLAANEPLRETDVFCPAGFAVFEEPIAVPDVAPEDGSETDALWVNIRAIGWHVTPGIANVASGKVGKGVSIFFYTTREDYETGYFQCLLDTGRQAPYLPTEVDDGFIPVEVLPWTFDVPWDARDTVGYIPGTVPNAIAYERRWFFAFMRLMWQQIIVHRREPMQRQQRRRLERLAERKPLLDYTVLRLRRLVDPLYESELTGTGRTLDHRVLVRGHWRNQYVPSLGPARDAHGAQIPETHRLVWIEAHWRGPEDGPVGAMEHATVVIR